MRPSKEDLVAWGGKAMPTARRLFRRTGSV
jgi:hypothetical protein